MKNTIFLLLTLLFLLAACQNSIQAELDEENENFSEATLRVQTRAGGTSSLTYPVYIYAFRTTVRMRLLQRCVLKRAVRWSFALQREIIR